MKSFVFRFISLFNLICVVCCVNIYGQNPSSIFGSIHLNQATYVAFVDTFGNGFHRSTLNIEVWKVRYVDVIKDEINQTRVYLNEKLPEVEISTSIVKIEDGANVQFKVSGIPDSGQYIALYYFTQHPANLKVFQPQSRIEDGSERAHLKYVTNAALNIGVNKKYGTFSILPIEKEQKYQTTIFANTTGIRPTGFWDSVGDFFEDVAELAWDGGKGLAGIVVDAKGTIFSQAYGIGQALFRDDGVIIPRYRLISAEEYVWANKNFFNNKLPSINKIMITNLLGLGKAPFVWPIGDGRILMNLGSQGFKNPMKIYLNGNIEGQVFIHELTHVWQVHTTKDIHWTLKALKTQVCNMFGYNVYKVECGQEWKTYNPEQQATLVELCYKNREKSKFDGCEQAYVEDHVRHKKFDKPVTPECRELISQLERAKKALEKRKSLLVRNNKKTRIIPASESQTGKPIIVTATIPEEDFLKDKTYRELKAEISRLNQEKISLNCN
ncbi:MAG: hypothetical protein ACKV1O_11880 [Saprospiraceae bacterium]